MNEITPYTGVVIAPKPLGADLAERFTNYLDTTEKTVKTYKYAVKQMFNYFQINEITAPTREDVIAYREELKASGYKATTIQAYITAAKLFFQWTAQENIYPNVADHLKGAKVSKNHKKDYLTSSQVKAIMQGIPTNNLQGLRDYAIFSLMVIGGLRTIEITRANIEDLRTNGDSTALYVQGKGRQDKADFIKIDAQTEKSIRAYLKARGEKNPTAPLFGSLNHSSCGQRMTTRSVSRLVKGYMQLAGYDSDRLTAHSLRHTAVTLSLLAGKPIEEVQQFARHSSIDITNIYNHALDAAKNSCSQAIADAIYN